MRTAKYLLSDKRQLGCVKKWLITNYGIPVVRYDLAIFAESGSTDDEIHVRFQNRDASITYIHDPNDNNSLPTPTLHMKMQESGTKPLFQLLRNLGFTSGSIGRAISYTFHNKQGHNIQIIADTFIGTILVTGISPAHKGLLGVLDEFGIVPVSQTTTKRLNTVAKVKKYKLIDEHGLLHPLIRKYCNEMAVNYNAYGGTLLERVEDFGNDYTYLEKAFSFIFGRDLVGDDELSRSYAHLMMPVSIVIPAYNADSTIAKTLLSIQSQNISAEMFEKVEVIVVDDGSAIPVSGVLANYEFPFKLKVIRHEHNLGSSAARNTGISLAQHKIVAFIDSDILLAKNYLLEQVLRSQAIPNAIFLAFKQNIAPDSPITEPDTIGQGLPKPSLASDMRISKLVDEQTPGVYKIKSQRIVELLGDTDHFKELGYGRHIGVFDLPSMVISHNLICSLDQVKKAGGFPTDFKGWGMEDTFFGASMIAGGNYVIPTMATGVYHIDHATRLGDNSARKRSLIRNIKLYKKKLVEHN